MSERGEKKMTDAKIKSDISLLLKKLLKEFSPHDQSLIQIGQIQ
jgi:hypothetical protein